MGHRLLASPSVWASNDPCILTARFFYDLVVQSDRGIRSWSARGGYPDITRACWMFLCILGRVPLDALFVLADGRSHAIEGCSPGLCPTVLQPEVDLAWPGDQHGNAAKSTPAL
eukprot:3062943-Pyramimonas_sp.AAC.1